MTIQERASEKFQDLSGNLQDFIYKETPDELFASPFLLPLDAASR